MKTKTTIELCENDRETIRQYARDLACLDPQNHTDAERHKIVRSLTEFVEGIARGAFDLGRKHPQ